VKQKTKQAKHNECDTARVCSLSPSSAGALPSKGSSVTLLHMFAEAVDIALLLCLGLEGCCNCVKWKWYRLSFQNGTFLKEELEK
uniref:Uncharacterized protein n=1 Tax=Piliocolobus tephrosceles TaxID=591936 RepID=A0A8C9GXW1_9PRIM